MSTPTAQPEVQQKKLKTKFLSHGTLGSKNLEATRKFYEEFLGINVIRSSPISMMIQLGGNHVYAVVQTGNKERMPRINHNGLDVVTDEEVDASYKLCCEQAELWGMHDISEPQERHGTYSFMFWDLDENAWEILSNPKGGYTWIFEQGDLEGKGHFTPGFRHNRPDALEK